MYCFRCGSELELVDSELRCMRGNMGLSKHLQGLLEEALSKPRFKPNIENVSPSIFRCPRCATPLATIPQQGLECTECGVHLTPGMTYQMIEIHPHAEVQGPSVKPQTPYHCWRCARAFKPMPDSGFFGPFYCPDCLKTHPELFQDQQSKQPKFEPEITARIHLFPTGEGGRKGASFTQIRVPMKIDGKDDAYHDCVVRLPEERGFQPGETFVADVQFLYPELVSNWLKEGMRFKLWELKFFAEGEVIAVRK